MSRTIPQTRRGRRWLAGAAFTLVVLIAAALVGLALRYQLDGFARWFWILAVGVTALAILALRAAGRRGASRAVLLPLVAVALGWWLTIRPSGDRDWAPDVAHGVTARI